MSNQVAAIIDCEPALGWLREKYPELKKQAKQKMAMKAITDGAEFPGKVDLNRLRDALKWNRIKDRQDWIDTLMALKHGDVAFWVADEWSSEQPDYQGTDDVLHTWQGLNTRGEITIATIFFRAKEVGWTDSKNRKMAKATKLERVMATANNLELVGNSELDIARNTIKSFGNNNLIYAQSQFHQWTEQFWDRRDDLEIKKQITRISELTNLAQLQLPAGQRNIRNITANRVKNILEHMKTEAFVPNVLFDSAVDTINVQNGELSFNDGNWELHPHRRESYRLSLIPITYNSEAQAPRFEQFLDEIFAGDDDCDDKKKCICQFLGYSLTTNCKYEKFLLLIGGGENGKGVLLYVVDKLVGSHNASAIDPSNFTKDFHLAHLRGKYVNLVPELAEGAEIDDAAFKSITSGDKKQASEKYKPLFDYYPYAKLWLGTNYLPHSRDVSHAFFRRPLIIEFNHEFRKVNDPDRRPEHQLADVDLKSKLLVELPGILNLALNGLASLRINGGFTEPVSSYNARASWRMGVDQVAQFVDERCRTGNGMLIDFKTLYAKYREWAVESGITKSFAKKKFGQRLDRMGFKNRRGTGGTYMRGGIEIDFSKHN